MDYLNKGLDRTQIKKGFRVKIVESDENNYVESLRNEKKPIFIKRNIYLNTRSSRRRLKIMEYSVLAFPPPSSCGSSSSICGSGCNCGCKCSSDECTNKPFQQRHIKKMKLVQTEICGYEIVAEKDIKQGDFIIEYVGEVIDESICQERLWEMNKKEERNFYLCQISWNMLIDSTYKGNKSRYINHSCNPNTKMQKWIIDGETRIGIFATRNIDKGEHLSYDYGFVQYGADQECYCGATCCRKTLGAKQNKTKNKSNVNASLESSMRFQDNTWSCMKMVLPSL